MVYSNNRIAKFPVNSVFLVFFLVVTFQVSLTAGSYVTYQRFREILISRSQVGDHWQELSRAKCIRYRKAVYSEGETTCRCPADSPNFFSNGDNSGCYDGQKIDPGKSYDIEIKKSIFIVFKGYKRLVMVISRKKSSLVLRIDFFWS